jgi:sulfonate transport system ATP-binding protein
VALADRVVVLEEGRVTLDLRIDLPRPRLRGDAEVAALEERVLRAILGSGTSTAQEDSFAGTGALESVLSS